MIIAVVGLLVVLSLIGAAIWHYKAVRRELDQHLEVARQVRDAQRRIDYIVRRTISDARREALKNQRQ